jgi:hypothetical protein
VYLQIIQVVFGTVVETLVVFVKQKIRFFKAKKLLFLKQKTPQI